MKDMDVKAKIVLGIEAILLGLLLLGKWIGVDYGFGSSYVTLWEAGRLLDDVSVFDSGSTVKLIEVLIYVGMAASLGAIGFAAVNAFRDCSAKAYGLCVPTAYAALMILVTVLTNASIKSRSGGWISSAFSLSAVPFIALACGIAGIVVLRRNDETDSNAAAVEADASAFDEEGVRNSCDVSSSGITEVAHEKAEKETTEDTAQPDSHVTVAPKDGKLKEYFDKNKKALLTALGGLAAATALLILVIGGNSTVKLDKYVTITADGYDSVGTASYAFDYDAFEKDYARKIKISKNSEYSGWTLWSGDSAAKILLDTCVEMELDKTSGLSNGDVVTLKWSCDDAKAEEAFHVKLKYSDITYKVKNLEEVDQFNPFDYVDISFSGVSPKGEMIITPNYDQREIQYIDFYADKCSGIKNGDTVTVTAEISGSVERFVEEFGSMLSEKAKTFTCDSIGSYVADVNGIPEDTMNKMKAQSEDVIKAYAANTFTDREKLNDISYVGNYYLTLKDGMYGDNNNYLYLVYKVQAANADSPKVDFYYFVRFCDIIVFPDGTCSVDMNDTITPSSTFEPSPTSTFYYHGYQDIDSLYNACVAGKIDNYQYTSTVK